MNANADVLKGGDVFVEFGEPQPCPAVIATVQYEPPAALTVTMDFALVRPLMSDKPLKGVGRLPRPARADAVATRFARLADEWRTGTAYLSSVRDIAAHRAYREIVAMGPAVVPLIIDELRKAPDHWFPALHELTGASPVPMADRGRMKAMAAAWVRWWDEGRR